MAIAFLTLLALFYGELKMIVFVDSGVLGILSSPNDKVEVQNYQF